MNQDQDFQPTFSDKMEEVLKDLIQLCEDNEVMKESIKDYFKKKFKVEEWKEEIKMDIYPSYVMIFVVFNLLGLWYKGQVFFSWWYLLPIAILQIILASIILAIAKISIQRWLEMDEGEGRYKELEKLEEENEDIRDKISKLIGIKDRKHPTWIKINELINNEIDQEELCD